MTALAPVEPRVACGFLGSVKNRGLLLAITLWDLAWRAAAIRIALRRHEYKWAAALGIVSSAGLLPMLYIARASSQAPESE